MIPERSDSKLPVGRVGTGIEDIPDTSDARPSVAIVGVGS